TIYPGSTILGGETVIGARSTIGGNVFLVQSVPPDSLVYYEEKQLRIVPKRKHKPATTRDEFREGRTPILYQGQGRVSVGRARPQGAPGQGRLSATPSSSMRLSKNRRQ